MGEKDVFLNRDVSWLEFNARVLHEALDDRTPLLERARFLGIFQNNLDEYFMKRMGSLYSDARVKFRNRLMPLLDLAHDCFTHTLLKSFKKEKIELLHWNDMTPAERDKASSFFHNNIFPVLTPLSLDSGHPFPFLSNLSVSLGVFLKNQLPEEDDHFARVKIPTHFPQWINLGNHRFVSIIEIIIAHLGDLFHGMEITEYMLFRVTRNTNIDHGDDSEDLMEQISEELKERRFGDIVRLEYWGSGNPHMIDLLRDELHLDEDQIYCVKSGLLEYTSLKPILDINRPDLKFEPWVPSAPPSLSDPDKDIFQTIKQHDILVHHPYESFSASVERFIRSAVNDPKVIAIKMTLYRTGADSPLIPLLIKAADLGKHVVCLVELKARFDEEKNILVAQRLEDAGVHVVYGVLGLKTHCKLTLVVRQEGDEVRCYSHIGTGNYHNITARLYTDFGLFTSKRDITDDVVHLFHFLTGKSTKRDYKKLLVAPLAMKDVFLKKIQKEAENAKKGLPARIIAKVNSMDERDITHALYEASQAGVKIDLIVRGYCTLRPGVKNLSENIRVISVIGRFLEHSRVFYFRSGAKREVDGEMLIGSADWMTRNLSARVEAITPVEEPVHKDKILEILEIMLDDHRQGWEMKSDGNYVRKKTAAAAKEIGTHAILMQKARNRA